MALNGAIPLVESDYESDDSVLVEDADSIGFDKGAQEKPIIIVGNGPVGSHLLNELFRLNYRGPIKIFGSEAALPYDRVQLSSLLLGGKSFDDIKLSIAEQDVTRLFQYHNCPIVGVNKEHKFVTDRNGRIHEYRSLILAVGSKPHIPQIDGVDLNGVFTFRDVQDTERLVARRVSSRHTVIVGGGLLGIEAAKAMRRLNTSVTIVHQAERLMNRQLDQEASDILAEHLNTLGIDVVYQNGLRCVNADEKNPERVESITLRSGTRIDCDTVILATGITPNIEIARKAWLKVRRGIVVDDTLQTNEENIYAIGECAEHDGQVYGLVAPGLEQASVLASRLCGEESQYKGSLLAPKLKVAGIHVFSMGDVGDEYETWGSVDALTFSDENEGEKIHRALFVAKGKVVGAVGVGQWDEIPRLQESIGNGHKLWPWHYYRFKKTGKIWGDSASNHVANWPRAAVVCNCKGVTRESLSEAVESGCETVDSLATCTGASTVCGSCKPLLEDLVNEDSQQTQGTKGAKAPWLMNLSLLSLALTLVFVALPPIPYLTSAINDFNYDLLWRDGFIKQVSGFSLLGLVVASFLISARKRVDKIKFGQFASWRTLHTIVGIALVATLISHTGARLGENLNYYLMLNFVVILCIGAMTGLFAALETRMASTLAIKTVKRWFTASHIYLLWPLPLLLIFHIIGVYYF